MPPVAPHWLSLVLAAAIIGGWAALHVTAIFLTASLPPPPVTLGVTLVQTWLSTGLFIVAHDCIHGSFAPGRPGVNRWTGRLCFAIYACLPFDRLAAAHRDHHRFAGTPDDPDFDPDQPRRYLPWLLRFFRGYYSHRQIGWITLVACAYLATGGTSLDRIVLFWAVPAVLAALQLFTFGTWLPHRHGGPAFPDHHNARSNGAGWLTSLVSCFHFGGYHHEHHLHPGVPWWGLPQTRKRERYPAKRSLIAAASRP
jgi:beta-carotene ketolase (CrtW type)